LTKDAYSAGPPVVADAPEPSRIASIPTKVFVAAINAMGANATPMNFGEMPPSRRPWSRR